LTGVQTLALPISGKSPFWKWLEEHFFSMDFQTADYLTGIGDKVFIAEWMPKYPI